MYMHVCGKYYQGRSQTSYAYTHSLEAGHHVYINLRTQKVYCLPDGCEIIDSSLHDIRHVLNPRFGELTRKIWHAKNFKGRVCPREFLQVVMKASKKQFHIGAQSDPVEFLSSLVNTLHEDLKSSKKNSSIIYQCFQGELEVVKEIQRRAPEKKENGNDQITDSGTESNDIARETARVPFLLLDLDLPPPPLFEDIMDENIIPQVPLFNILMKFDGEMVTEVVHPQFARMRYRVTRLPPYLVLHMRRFTKNNLFTEKNPTLVTFPVKNLELKDYIPLPTLKDNEVLRSKYDLVANIVHDGRLGEDSSYRVCVQRKS